jgi:hypothetical protein
MTCARPMTAAVVRWDGFVLTSGALAVLFEFAKRWKLNRGWLYRQASFIQRKSKRGKILGNSSGTV